VTAAVEPGDPDGNDGWYVAKPRLTLTGADAAGGSGFDRVEYRVDGGSWQTYAESILLDDGTSAIDYRAVDAAGSMSAPANRTLKVDTAAPTTTPALNGSGPVVVSATAADSALGSGVATTEIRVDGGAWSAYTGPRTVTEAGAHTVELRSTDVAGNVEAVRQVTFTIAAGGPQAQGDPPKPGTIGQEPSAAIDRARGLALRTFHRRGLRVDVSCAWIDSGTLRLTVSSRVARKLGLRGKRTLASTRVRCDTDGRMTVVLKPGKKVRKALAKSKASIRATLTLRLDSGDVARTDRLAVVLAGRKRGH